MTFFGIASVVAMIKCGAFKANWAPRTRHITHVMVASIAKRPMKTTTMTWSTYVLAIVVMFPTAERVDVGLLFKPQTENPEMSCWDTCDCERDLKNCWVRAGQTPTKNELVLHATIYCVKAAQRGGRKHIPTRVVQGILHEHIGVMITIKATQCVRMLGPRCSMYLYYMVRAV